MRLFGLCFYLDTALAFDSTAVNVGTEPEIEDEPEPTKPKPKRKPKRKTVRYVESSSEGSSSSSEEEVAMCNEETTKEEEGTQSNDSFTHAAFPRPQTPKAPTRTGLDVRRPAP